MIALTKKRFENRLLFLQKLYYNGYITEAEREDLVHPITQNDILWCNNITTAECRRVVTYYRCSGGSRELPVIEVDNEFIVFEDNNGNLKYDILEDKIK